MVLSSGVGHRPTNDRAAHRAHLRLGACLRACPAVAVAFSFAFAFAACGGESAAARTGVDPDSAPPADTRARSVALTFDDLPGVFLDTSFATARAANEELVASLERAHAHATGFVNEDKLRGSDERVALLELWLDRALDLGNHTWGHPDLHRIPLADYQDAVLRGEVVTRRIMSERGTAPRFFRHTFLHTGRDTATRNTFERFLAAHGYRVAPVTLDNYDYVWARAYDRALTDGDSAAALRVARGYVAYMDTVFGFYEAQSRTLFGREPAQVLLLHVNRLNAEHMDALLGMIDRRGYRVVPLDVALEDPIYESADGYTGAAGLTWLHRWAITRGTPGSAFAGEPGVPAWIERLND
ncbi:MAG TPA: polysaccharide deacetylase family protein [Longimicrobiales bacterium]